MESSYLPQFFVKIINSKIILKCMFFYTNHCYIRHLDNIQESPFINNVFNYNDSGGLKYI